MSQQRSRQESTPATVTVFASPTSWIESDAVAQCHQVATLDGMMHVAAMPDLHPGKGAPIGVAMASAILYLFLVGSDIGCGIAVFPVKLKRAVPERLAARFPDLDRALDPEQDADDPAWAVLKGDIPAGHVEGLGTVGRGNHFVELSRVGTVFEPDHASRPGLAAGDLVLIVHSGSRGVPRQNSSHRADLVVRHVCHAAHPGHERVVRTNGSAVLGPCSSAPQRTDSFRHGLTPKSTQHGTDGH
ncbi:RtcB family protein [Nonomuraea sp. B5E05]|uniref:RtcB family protein n=1 Tax=Nonomuraea sp. B5E05 TaxID=3153569 RepID=UPI0032607D1E